MARRFLPVALLCLLLTSCLAHSYGPRKTETTPGETGRTTLETGKSIYVTLTGAQPEVMKESPESVILTFAKFLAPVAQVTPGETFERPEAAFQKASAAGSDYAVLVGIDHWGGQMLSGASASVSISVFEPATGSLLLTTRLEGTCYVMLMGLEPSIRECLRPQVEEWLGQVFRVPVQSRPYADVMPPQ